MELVRWQTTTATTEGEPKSPLMEGNTVVFPKKRRFRGALRQKILIKWRNYTFPCTCSDLLTPATLIEDVGRNPRISPAVLAKAILTPPNNLLATLRLNTPLCIQGITTGDILTLVVRHAQIYDPYDVQHFVAYREEDTILCFLVALRDIFPIPLWSEIVICHKGLPLDPASRFQDCNLPHDPTLHVQHVYTTHQHTVAHCNILQHHTKHFNTLQRHTPRRNTL